MMLMIPSASIASQPVTKPPTPVLLSPPSLRWCLCPCLVRHNQHPKPQPYFLSRPIHLPGQQQRRQQNQQKAPAKASKPDPWLSGTAPATTTALAMSQNPDRSPDRLSFGCPNLDAAFGGGVCVQGITEVYGLPFPPVRLSTVFTTIIWSTREPSKRSVFLCNSRASVRNNKGTAVQQCLRFPGCLIPGCLIGHLLHSLQQEVNNTERVAPEARLNGCLSKLLANGTQQSRFSVRDRIKKI